PHKPGLGLPPSLEEPYEAEAPRTHVTRARRGLEPYCERDASRAGLLEMRPFGEAKSISGHQTLQLMRRPYGVRSKGKRVRCHTPCLPKVPRGRARRSRATTRERIPHRQGDRRRPSRGTSRPTGNTGETWEGNPIGSQRIHSTCSLPDFIFIRESKRMGQGGVRDETRLDLRQSGASGGMAACAVPSFRIPDRFRHYSNSELRPNWIGERVGWTSPRSSKWRIILRNQRYHSEDLFSSFSPGKDEAPIPFQEQAEEETTASHANPAQDQEDRAAFDTRIKGKIDAAIERSFKAFLSMVISYARLRALSCILPPPSGAYLICLVCLSESSALSKMGRLWALTFTPVIVMTFEFCQRGATVDTPFLTVLKTWTSPFEHSVIIHDCVRLEFPEVSAHAPCLRIPELDCLVSGFAPNTFVLP
ncbi:hypothetical protein HYC85_015461, partial [Camellia sinensis]